MAISQRSKKVLRAMNYDMFQPEAIAPPSPATLYTKIMRQAEAIRNRTAPEAQAPSNRVSLKGSDLPDEDQLYRWFEMINWEYFGGRLPKVRIVYSNRMRTAGSYEPALRRIKIGRKYHEIFPDEVVDTLKHEMIHIVHLKHDAAFKAEAFRIGASLRARSHPSLRRLPKYIYICPTCSTEYPRQKRLRMASCGKCSKRGRYDGRFKLILHRSAAKGTVE